MTRLRSPQQERADDQAIAWLVTLNADGADEADWLHFTAWLEASANHREAFDRAEQLWADLDNRVPELRAALIREPALPAASPRRARSRRQRRPSLRPWLIIPMAAAAGFAALLVATPDRPLQTPRETVYQTGLGQRQLATLGDGTRVVLNAKSRVRVTLTAGERRVGLDPGSEVAFDVHHEAQRPFVVVAGDRRIQVLGTEFVADRQDGRLVVTVRRGVVQVASISEAPAAKPIRLVRGQQLTHAEETEASAIRRVAPDDAFSWIEGRRVYRDAPLGTVASDLNRYLTIPIKVDAGAAQLRFSGVVVIDNEDAVVRRLELLLPISADRGPSAITLRVRRDRPRP